MQDLIKSGIPVDDTISTRDDIMTSLIAKGVDPSKAFKIMEACRKGKKAHKQGLPPDLLDSMKKAMCQNGTLNLVIKSNIYSRRRMLSPM